MHYVKPKIRVDVKSQHMRFGTYFLCANASSKPSADPEGGGQGVRTPLENHKLYGFLKRISN